jgi:CO/xanthine dehydrogenase FAD-binding subunit
MEFLQPRSLPEALAAKAERPGAVPIAGGTDVMVELNFDHRRPEAVLDLARVPELAVWDREDGRLRVGAGITYTIGGNLGSASPAGDCHPPLLAMGAEVEVASTAGRRRVPIEAFFTGPKKSALEPSELILAVWLPPASGPQQFAKIGTRNAMVIAVCSFALALDPERGRVGTGIGSAGPTPLPAPDAERFLQGVLDSEGLWASRAPIGDRAAARFGELVAASARPIDDVRGTAAYRVHALGVLARRTLAWAWDEYRSGRS